MMTNHITLYRFCSAVRRKAALALCLTLCVLGLGISAIAQQPTIITFNAPGAVDYGTYAWCINTQGAIVGYYFDTSFVAHGYLRAPDGRITLSRFWALTQQTPTMERMPSASTRRGRLRERIGTQIR